MPIKKQITFDEVRVGDWLANKFVKGFGRRLVVGIHPERITWYVYFGFNYPDSTLPGNCYKENFPFCYKVRQPK